MFDIENFVMDNTIVTLRGNISFIGNLSEIEARIKKIEKKAKRTLSDPEIKLLLKIMSN